MLSEVKKCSQGHTGQKRKGQDLNLDCLSSFPGPVHSPPQMGILCV